MQDAIRQALALTRSSSARERTVDITTTGRRSGRPRRIEIWFYRAGGAIYLSGLPGERSWYANLRARPAFTLHLKHGVRADLPATARFVTDPADRHRILSEIVDDLNQPHDPARIVQPTRLADWENGSPLVEIVLDDRPSPDLRPSERSSRSEDTRTSA
ncbi:nitroreductase/quinone reductase family protein [Actinomadura sp. 9N407]|uniref:nitroreductase/quinone reductase family protein n=1 Tax=Actinomadura sp. 9N407 TaxID=3375154 RepID=UPI0037A9F3ED